MISGSLSLVLFFIALGLVGLFRDWLADRSTEKLADQVWAVLVVLLVAVLVGNWAG